MSFLAKLIVEGLEYTVLECAFSISKEQDETGKPSSVARAGQITLTVRIRERDKIFFNWTKNNTITKDGAILFYKDNAMAIMDKLMFKKAYCMHYGMEFHAENAFIANIVLSAREITYGGDTYTN